MASSATSARWSGRGISSSPNARGRLSGAAGGTWESKDRRHGAWEATPIPGPVRDSYGCGDSFAAGLTYGLGAGLDVDAALRIGARCGAACLTGHGPYAGQLTAADL